MNSDDMNLNANQNVESSVEGLAVRAWNFVHQHRPELDRKLKENPIKPAKPETVGGNGEGSNRGHVTDPKHDQRLKQNKEKNEQDNGGDSGSEEARAAEEHKKKVEERLEQLQKIDNQVRKPVARPVEAAFSMAPKPATPKPQMAPQSKPQASPAPVAPKSSFTLKQKPLSTSLSPNVPENIAKTTPAVPKNEVPKGMGQEEADLRFHPKHGPMVQRLLGPGNATPEKMKGVYRSLHLANQLEMHQQNYKQLQAAFENANTVAEKNALQIKISQTALAIAQLGGLNKNG